VAQAVETAANAPTTTDAASLASSQTYWVAVCGAPASGKTTLTLEVGRRLNEEQHIPTIVVPMDGYHFYKHELDVMIDPKAMHARRGAPWTFNVCIFLTRVYYSGYHRVWVAMSQCSSSWFRQSPQQN
jgi:pantothenate kinase